MKRKPDYLKILKIAAGTGISIITADFLGLRYSASAGVITLLSVQDTKKETIRVVGRRLASFVLALVLSAVCFHLFGYGALAVTVFLLFFAAACIEFHMQEGISVNTVLMTHFLAEQSMGVADILNEVLLLLVGAGIGVVLNLYIPGKKKLIKASQIQIEDRMRDILGNMAEALLGQAPRCGRSTPLLLLENDLELGEKQAYEDMENTLLAETRYYLRYMNMRKSQALVLARIEKQMCMLEMLPLQAEQIAGLMGQISERFHEFNNAVELMEELESVKMSMREQPLPSARPEFENRAILFQILMELDQFLSIKMEFVQELGADEIRKFWKSESCRPEWRKP